MTSTGTTMARGQRRRRHRPAVVIRVRRRSKALPNVEAAVQRPRLKLGGTDGALLRVLRVHLASSGALLPEDPEILAALGRCFGAGAPSSRDWALGIQRMLAQGVLERVIVGRCAHLCWSRRSEASVPGPEGPGDEREPGSPDLEGTSETSRDFERRVQLDVEKERLLLYRTSAAFALVVHFMLLRELLLALL